MSEVISKNSLRNLVEDWLGRMKTAAGPVRLKGGLVAYLQLRSAGQLLLESGLKPANSIKEFVFPRHEKLFGYRFSGNRVELLDPESSAAEQLILAARPCDAAALALLDHVFNWDFKDELYNEKRAQTTVITLACSNYDSSCFCTSVNLSPASDRGSDALLLDLGDDCYEVRCFSEKGQRLFAGRTGISDRIAGEPEGPQNTFDPGDVRRFVEENFESPFWNERTLACLGCGACAYTCPTCHCFDMVDEGDLRAGERVRNWDSCQFAAFTLHASGHNPRGTQSQRQRQRLYHKFGIYPRKFGEILCTGCGNCTRNCPVGLGVSNVLSEMGHAKHL